MKKIEEINHPLLKLIKLAEDVGAYSLMLGKNKFTIIASFRGEWDHVSVSNLNRCPTWEEMSFIKDIFFKDDEAAVQYHPKKNDYINLHKYCLHMWRPQKEHIPTPNKYMVGI